jgi:hypothetical protein
MGAVSGVDGVNGVNGVNLGVDAEGRSGCDE